jgi:hypothetical protein
MKHEYRYKNGPLIFCVVLLIALMAGCLLLGISPFIYDHSNQVNPYSKTVLAIAFEILLVKFFLDIVKFKITVDEYGISVTGGLSTRSLRIKDIKGFRFTENKIIILVPISKEFKNIQISSYIKDHNQLEEWIRKNFTDLDLEDIETDIENIEQSEKFGNSLEQRYDQLSLARKASKILNVISFFICLSTFLYPHFYTLQIILCSLLPITGIIVYKIFNGLVKLDGKENDVHPNLSITFILPTFALLVRALNDFNIFSFHNLWFPACSIVLCTCILVFLGSGNDSDQHKAKGYLSFSLTIVYSSIYAYSFIITTNAIFHSRKNEIYKAEVVEKLTSTGNDHSYYLRIGQWGPQQKVKKVSVKHSLYDEKEPGDSVEVLFIEGFYKIPYYIIKE